MIPAACTTTELQGATSLTGPLAAEPTPDDTAQVLVSLTCSNPSQTPAATTSPDPTDTKTSAPIADSTRSVQLLVHLTGRDGRWEVAPLTTTHP
ncbi:Uncharacterised protein [Mycobacteroides abscessus subsp. abscessus]|nr:Uncharacterised protein [Mycobacteroides abscessus subsp. abscessus]